MQQHDDDELPPLTKAEVDRMMVAIATVTPPIVANGNPLLQRLLDQKKGKKHGKT